MAEQTLETRLSESVKKYTEAGNKIDKFINGSASETIATVNGNKPTLSKIVKDTEDNIDSAMTGLTTKANEANTSAENAAKAKTDAEAIVNTFNSTHLATMQQNTIEIAKNKEDIAAIQPYLTESHENGNSWYRKYSDGFIEQGGVYYQGSSANKNVNFIVPFKRKVLNVTAVCGTSSSYGAQASGVLVGGTTLTRFTGTSYGGGVGNAYWIAKGY